MTTEKLSGMLAELMDGRGVPTFDENGEIALTVEGVKLKLSCLSSAAEDIYCHAVVGSVAGLAHPDRVLEDVLEANFFWSGTAGGTLSILPGTDNLMLADRRDGDYFDSAETLKDYLSAFASKVVEWRVYLDDCREEKEVR